MVTRASEILDRIESTKGLTQELEIDSKHTVGHFEDASDRLVFEIRDLDGKEMLGLFQRPWEAGRLNILVTPEKAVEFAEWILLNFKPVEEN